MTKIIAEIGINHQGSIEQAIELIQMSAWAGADYVKFQKRDPEICVPLKERDIPKQTPWGQMPYIDYRHRMEFSREEYERLIEVAQEYGLGCFLSVWDMSSAKFAAAFQTDIVKIPSAKLTDHELLALCRDNFGCVIISTGMSTEEQVVEAMKVMRNAHKVVWMHCHSGYPAPVHELNLRLIEWLRDDIAWESDDVGYSGHEFGLSPTLVAVGLGATWIERHITLDRWSWGSDQMASIEPLGFAKMVSHVRAIEDCLGDGIKRVWDSELPAQKKLRGEPRTVGR